MQIYIDGTPYLESDNNHIRSHIIDKLENMEVTCTTSGTTGHPQTVTHSPEVIDHISKFNADWFGLTNRSKMLSLYSTRGIAFTTMSLYPCVIADSDLYIETDVSPRFIDRVHEIRPTHGLILPNMWRVLHKHRRWEDLDLSSYEQCIVGSDYTAEGCLEDLRAKGAQSVYNVYGATEVPPNVLMSEVANTYTLDSNPDCEVHIEDGQIVARWKVQDKLWRSGDLVEETADGYKLVGRELNMFKMGECGIRVYPEQIESKVVHAGADLALCRHVNGYCMIYYTGELNESLVDTGDIPKVRYHKVHEIKVDNNLRKIDRTQEFSFGSLEGSKVSQWQY